MKINERTVRDWWHAMKEGQLVEVRVLSNKYPSGEDGPVYSGIFSDCDSLVRAVADFEVPQGAPTAMGIYFSLNVLQDYCRDWQQYGVIRRGSAVKGEDIARRQWLLADFDPKRPPHCCATEAEKETAMAVANSFIDDVCTNGPLPKPYIVADSGNGVHLYWRCDIDNTPAATQAVRGFLAAAKLKYSIVDTAVSDPNRVSRIPGTMNTKGDHPTEKRPHRLTVFTFYDKSSRALDITDLNAAIAHLKPAKTNDTPVVAETQKTALNGKIGAILADVEYCVAELEQRGITFAADRDRWFKATAGWYHTLGVDGLALFLRFSALWEHNAPEEDRAKYMEMSRYPREDGATIESFFALCREVGVERPAARADWRGCVYDYTVAEEEPEPLVAIGGSMLVSRENICVVSGRPKAAKTTFGAAMLAAVMRGGTVLNMTAPQRLRVLWADTEQSKYHLSRQVDRAFRLAGRQKELSDDFCVLALRPFTPTERFDIVKAALADFRPDLLFLDGAADLIIDSNDLQQSEALVAELLTLTSQHACGIVTIVHSNPSDPKTRGHLGSCLERKAESVVLLTREDMGREISVKPRQVRNRPFDEFSFYLNEIGDPELQPDNEPKTAEDWLLELMEPGKMYRHCDLLKMLAPKGAKKSTVTNALQSAIQGGYVAKRDGNYTLTETVGRSIATPLYMGGGPTN